MPTAAVSDYDFSPADAVAQFHGQQLLYLGWDDHLMFCAPFCVPVAPTMSFADLVQGVLPVAFGAHPDFAKIDWSRVEWFKSGEPWHPDAERSLADNGVGHKDVLRFRTPGLRGINGSRS